MFVSQIFTILKSRSETLRELTGVLALLLAVVAVPAHAQFTFQDLFDLTCNPGTGCGFVDHGRLARGGDGTLYGTTQGGFTSNGTIFSVSTTLPASYSDVWKFDGVDGATPVAALTLGSDGNYYGTTSDAGTNGFGMIFQFVPPPFSFITIVHNFASTEGYPETPPVQGKDGNFYGVTHSGVTYSFTLSLKYTKLASVAPGEPGGPLLLAADGYLYGTTLAGGKHNLGTIFRMTTPGGAIKTVYSFDGSAHGSAPWSPLTQTSDGYIFGTTSAGGANGTGGIFKLALPSTVTQLFSFDPFSPPGSFCNTNGASPLAGLLSPSDGNLYGVTSTGGANCAGTIFQTTETGAFAKLFDFTGSGGDVPGNLAITTLMENSDGSYYGLTANGGTGTNGNYFRLTPLNLREILIVQGPIFVTPGTPVILLGDNLTHVIEVQFGGAQAQFSAGSDTSLSATVPYGALDGVVVATFDTGLQVQTVPSVYMLPVITSLDPASGPVGTSVDIAGGGFTGATKVTFGGVATGNFVVLSSSLIQATVPSGAKTGKVKVTTPHGTATSAQKFTVN
jgi:uncharacterized repeat protein (TIGR03803 family)